jgi:hypothetical protein
VARRLVVVGAGPSGLAAALLGLDRGLDVTVLERDRVGASLLGWGPDVRFFSPLAWNVSPEMAEAVGGLGDGDALLTGPAFVERILRPIAAGLGDRVRVGHRVVGIGRAGLLRGDFAGHPLRAERPFRLLVEADGAEEIFEADLVLDASGTWGNPTWLGDGGLPARGERGVPVIRDLGALSRSKDELRDRRVLLVGHGHSAAHAIAALGDAGATVVWATRSGHGRPVVDVASDPLPERRDRVAAANALAAKPPPWLRMERRARVEAITPGSDGLEVALSGGRRVTIDRIVALTGTRPDLSFLGELALRISPATEGADGLARALANVTDCLSVPEIAPGDLASGEPGFHLIGAKSYGRSRTFLLRTGYRQIATMIDG